MALSDEMQKSQPGCTRTGFLSPSLYLHYTFNFGKKASRFQPKRKKACKPLPAAACPLLQGWPKSAPAASPANALEDAHERWSMENDRKAWQSKTGKAGGEMIILYISGASGS
jgi:hypothetical protein